MIPERYAFVYRLNPVMQLIDAYRAVLVRGELPAPAPLLMLTLIASGGLAVGFLIFRQASYRFADEL
jgi:lipopolysaccharide transport system permease protein